MLLLVLFGLFVILTIVGIFKKGFVILTIVGIFKKGIEDLLFLVYSVLACLIVGYTIFGLFRVFCITLNDAVNLAIAIALMVIPGILKFRPEIKKWIKALLSIVQLAILIAAIGIFAQTYDQNCIRGSVKGIIPKIQDSAFLFKTCRLAGFEC